MGDDANGEMEMLRTKCRGMPGIKNTGMEIKNSLTDSSVEWAQLRKKPVSLRICGLRNPQGKPVALGVVHCQGLQKPGGSEPTAALHADELPHG